jgi:hypothetical protein
MGLALLRDGARETDAAVVAPVLGSKLIDAHEGLGGELEPGFLPRLAAHGFQKGFPRLDMSCGLVEDALRTDAIRLFHDEETPLALDDGGNGKGPGHGVLRGLPIMLQAALARTPLGPIVGAVVHAMWIKNRSPPWHYK